jgi:CPA1 family monovalent cation:H+ antiporter
MVLEGESLLNDASSLLIYRLAVSAVATGGISIGAAAPAFALVAFGSVAAGWGLAKFVARMIRRVDDAAIATVLQFVTTYGVWILAERLQLSGVITIVSFGLTAARESTSSMPTLVRVRSYATCGSITFVLNVLAFVLVGMQLRGTLLAMEGGAHVEWLGVAAVCLAVVIVIRFVWGFLYRLLDRNESNNMDEESFKAVLVVGWCGMRGIVTVAAALALPVGFPYRDFILITAFVVVLGTLLIQGLTLSPLLQWLDMPRDSVVQSEIRMARSAALKAALHGLDNFSGPDTRLLRREYRLALADAKRAGRSSAAEVGALRMKTILHARTALDALRDGGTIGDEAYRRVEEELDWLELSNRQ